MRIIRRVTSTLALARDPDFALAFTHEEDHHSARELAREMDVDIEVACSPAHDFARNFGRDFDFDFERDLDHALHLADFFHRLRSRSLNQARTLLDLASLILPRKITDECFGDLVEGLEVRAATVSSWRLHLLGHHQPDQPDQPATG